MTTKAPWAADGYYVIFTDEDGVEMIVAKAERRQDDARLIAATPDLLAACEWALRVEEGGRPEGAHTPYVEALRAAIAKAKGAA